MGKKKETPEGIVEKALCRLLEGHEDYELGKLSRKFKVVQSDCVNAPVVIEIKNNTANIIATEYVAACLRMHVEDLSGAVGDYNATYATCKRVVDSWVHRQKDLDELPIPVAFRDDPRLCMTRLDFNPTELKDEQLAASAPLFSEILTRITNSDAFCMRIGSIYDTKADRKQATWLSGGTDAGKSQIVWLLETLSGGGFAPMDGDILDTAWWKAEFVGKRVILVNEAPTKFIRTSAFKAITGDHNHTVNSKGKQPYKARIDALIFFFSNEPPEIPHDDALIERIIDCRVTPVPPGKRLSELELREKLTQELPWIAGYCIAKYRKLKTGDRIPTNSDDLKETIDAYEADYLDFLEHHYVFSGNPEDFVNRKLMRNHIEAYFGHDTKHQFHCKRILRNRFGIEEKKQTFKTNASVKDGEEENKRLYVYPGVRERSEKEKQFMRDPKKGAVAIK